MRRTMLVLATLVVVLVVAGGVALARADCRWDSATGWNCYCGPGVPCDTTNKQEIIYGSPVGDTINAYGGDDTIWGRDGNDIIVGGEGSELIDGGPDYDRCDGGNGYDYATKGAAGCDKWVRIEGEWQ